MHEPTPGETGAFLPPPDSWDPSGWAPGGSWIFSGHRLSSRGRNGEWLSGSKSTPKLPRTPTLHQHSLTPALARQSRQNQPASSSVWREDPGLLSRECMTSGKEPACQCRRCMRRGFDPWVGKIPWRRKLQFRCRVRTGESGLVLCGGMELCLPLQLPTQSDEWLESLALSTHLKDVPQRPCGPAPRLEDPKG